MGDGPDSDSPEKAVHDSFLGAEADPSVPFTTIFFHELNGGGVDDLNNDDSTARMRFYQPGMSGTPDLEFDGGYIEIGGFSDSQRSIDETNIQWAVSESTQRYDNKPIRPLERLTWNFPFVRLEVDQMFDGTSFFVQGKAVYDGNAKTVGAPALRGSLYVFMVEDNVTAYSKVYDLNVTNDAVFRGYALEGETFTLNNNEEHEFTATWSIPDAKVPIKPQDVHAIAAVFDTADTSSSAGGTEGNTKAGSPRCVQSATSMSTAYDRDNKPPKATSVQLSGNTIIVSMDDEGGISKGFVFINTESPQEPSWTPVELTLTGEEICDDQGVCYAYSEATGSAAIEYSGGPLYAQVLLYDDQMAQSSSPVFSIVASTASSKGDSTGALPVIGGPVTLLVIGIVLVILGPALYFLSKKREGGLFKLLSKKGTLVVIVAIGIIISVFAVGSLARSDTSKVPGFSVTDTNGAVHTPDSYEGKVLVIDIMFADCEWCNKEMPDVVSTYRTAKERYGDDVAFLSVSILEEDTDQKLDAFQSKYGAEWPIARDPDFKQKFDAFSVPKMVIIAPNGDIAYTHKGVIDREDVLEAIKDAHEGTYSAVRVTQTSSSMVAIGAMAAVFGAVTFFSPCSFPMLPGYFTYYISADAKRKETGGRTNPLTGGILAGLGIITFFLLIGVLVALFGAIIQRYLGMLMPFIGGILLILGFLSLIGKDAFLERAVDLVKRPFKALSSKFRKERSSESGSAGLYAYGFGYGAASSSCMAPVFIGVILLGFAAGGLIGGAVVFILYALSLGALMVLFSYMASTGGSGMQKIIASSAKVKKVSGALLMGAGAFVLLYYFWLYKYLGGLLPF